MAAYYGSKGLIPAVVLCPHQHLFSLTERCVPGPSSMSGSAFKTSFQSFYCLDIRRPILYLACATTSTNSSLPPSGELKKKVRPSPNVYYQSEVDMGSHSGLQRIWKVLTAHQWHACVVATPQITRSSSFTCLLWLHSSLYAPHLPLPTELVISHIHIY